MLINQVKSENLAALKEKDNVKRAIFSVIINKYNLAIMEQAPANEEGHNQVLIKILQKTLRELEEEGENYKKIGNTAEFENIQKQRKIINKYLPKMLSEQEIKEIILPLEDKSVPSVMRYFKTNYAGKCDMRIVLQVLKTINAGN